MLKKVLAGKLLLAVVISGIAVLPLSDAFAKQVWLKKLPGKHEIVVVKNKKYYYSGGRYYKPGAFNFGFVLVTPSISKIVRVHYTPVKPVIFQEQVIINVPNSDGSFTAVTLVKYNNGYIGPQGEYYASNPRVEQLMALYAR